MHILTAIIIMFKEMMNAKGTTGNDSVCQGKTDQKSIKNRDAGVPSLPIFLPLQAAHDTKNTRLAAEEDVGSSKKFDQIQTQTPHFQLFWICSRASNQSGSKNMPPSSSWLEVTGKALLIEP